MVMNASYEFLFQKDGQAFLRGHEKVWIALMMIWALKSSTCFYLWLHPN